MYLDRFNLKGRVAVVTGGGQGIGLACVEALSEAGAYVYIVDRNLRVAKEAQAAMKAKGYAPGVIWFATRASRDRKLRPRTSPTSIG